MDSIGTRLWLARKAGLLGVDLFLVLLVMWSSGRLGQRAVCRAAADCGKALAGAIGMLSWPTQSALSRAFASVELVAVRQFAAWLFGEALPVKTFERDGCCYYRDTQGGLWRVVDGDGRVLAFRQRALPTGPELPSGKRRLAKVAAPGYPGRKRGEVQLHRMLVQDAGCDRYLGVRLAPGNGEHHEEILWAAGLTRGWAEALGHPPERTVLRLDGKSTGAPTVAAALGAGIAFLTRWKDYALLETPAIRQTMLEATWSKVPDSGSGPTRYATELGLVRLEGVAPSAEGPLGPAQVRIVVSRYRVGQEEARGCGVTLDGWRYELYATMLGADVWPAAELVELYYGRSGEENRFMQADAELHKLRLLSAHLPGQELAVAAALFLSNLRLSLGEIASGWRSGPDKPPPPRCIETLPAEPPKAGDLPPATPEQTDASSPPPEPLEAERVEPGPVEPEPVEPEPVEPTSLSPAATLPAGTKADAEQRDPSNGAEPAKPGTCLRAGLATFAAMLVLYRDQLLERLPGWSWPSEPAEPGVLTCPAGHAAQLFSAEPCGMGAHQLRLRVPCPTCRQCSSRALCTSSNSPRFSREVWLRVGPPATPKQPRRTSADPVPTVAATRSATARWTPPCATTPGPLQATAPSLVPAVLRRSTAHTLGVCRLDVHLDGFTPSRKRPQPWLATSPAERQHRRATTEERLGRRQRPLASICVAAPAGVRPEKIRRLILLGQPHESKRKKE